MKTYFKSIKEARKSLDTRFEGNAPLNRDETAKALRISTATLHRWRKSGRIVATIIEFNGVKCVQYLRRDIAIMMYKRGV